MLDDFDSVYPDETFRRKKQRRRRESTAAAAASANEDEPEAETVSDRAGSSNIIAEANRRVDDQGKHTHTQWLDD